MKVINDLLGYKNLKIIQNTDFFSFSLDSILLPNFFTCDKNVKKILDIGTGNAPIPLILSQKTSSQIYGIEIQKDLYDLAVETLKINNLENRISLINDDANNLMSYFKAEDIDVILSNPPYFKVDNQSKRNVIPQKAIARHELKLNLDQLLKISYKLLKNTGKFAMVYRTERVSEVLTMMSKYRLEPKRLLFVFPKKGLPSNLFLVEGVKNAKPGIKSVNYLVAHDEDGSYTREIEKFFS